MTILVTGGAGFIGSNFVRAALESPEPGCGSVVNLDLLTYAGNMENLADLADDKRHVFVRGDIGDRELVAELLRTHRPRAIINFAAESHVDRSIRGAGTFVETNIVGLFKLLEAAREYWNDLPETAGDGEPTRASFRFLQVSTDEVYGSLSPDEEPFAETRAYQPNSPYSASKAAGDHLVRAWRHTYGLPVLTTNCSNNYGPYQFPEKLIPLTILNALTGRSIPVYGDGRQIRDWLHVHDHCLAILRVLERGIVGQVYNIGGLNEVPNIDVVHVLCATLDRLRPRDDGRSYSEQITFVTDRPGHDRRYAIDNTRISSELGWAPSYTFETGLEQTVRWNLENGDWLRNVQSGAYRDWVVQQYGGAA